MDLKQYLQELKRSLISTVERQLLMEWKKSAAFFSSGIRTKTGSATESLGEKVGPGCLQPTNPMLNVMTCYSSGIWIPSSRLAPSLNARSALKA